MSIDPILSPGWSHYIIVAPLGPKARVNLNRKLRIFSDRDRHFKPLAAHTLCLPILDLGVISEAMEPRIIPILDRLIQTCASLQVHAQGWSIDFEAPHTQENHQSKPTSHHQKNSSLSQGFLWLTWEDRLGMLSILRRELERELKEVCADLSCVTPRVSQKSTQRSLQKKRETFSVLCGYFSEYKSDTYDSAFKNSTWLNEIYLQKRPQRFHPSNGYQSVWRHALPFETPTLTDHDLDPVMTTPQRSTRVTSNDPMTGRDLELFNLLERRLEQSHQTSSPSTRSKSQRRRRRPRNKKRSS